MWGVAGLWPRCSSPARGSSTGTPCTGMWRGQHGMAMNVGNILALKFGCPVHCPMALSTCRMPVAGRPGRLLACWQVLPSRYGNRVFLDRS